MKHRLSSGSYDSLDTRRPKRPKLIRRIAPAQGTFSCLPCNKNFTTKKALLRHLRENSRHIDQARDLSRPFACTLPGCQLTFVRAYDRERHEKEQHGDGKIECSGCGRKIRAGSEHKDRAGQPCSAYMGGLRSNLPSSEESTLPPVTKTARHCREQIAKLPEDLHLQDLLGLPSHKANGDSSGITKSQASAKQSSHSKRSRRSSTVSCGLCRAPFEQDDPDKLWQHLGKHIDGFSHGYECQLCRISFANAADLARHERSAQSGDCGFAFEHTEPCSGHHPPSADVFSNAKSGRHRVHWDETSSDADRFNFCYRLRSWEQLQLYAYKVSVACFGIVTALPFAAASVSAALFAQCYSSQNFPNRAYCSMPGGPGIPDYENDIKLTQAFKMMSIRGQDVLAEIAYRPNTTDDPMDLGVFTNFELDSDANSQYADSRIQDSSTVASSWQDILCRSAYAGDIAAVQVLLASGHDANALDVHGYTALHYAVWARSIPTIELLLESSADTTRQSQDGISPLATAVYASELTIIPLLLRGGPAINTRLGHNTTYPLHHAVQTMNIPLIELLISQGAELNTVDPNLGTVLHLAVRNREKQRQLETDSGVSIELTLRNRHQQSGMIKLLLQHGADINVHDANNVSILHEMIHYNNGIELLEQFLDAGIHIDDSRSPHSVLLDAISCRATVSVIQRLLHAGADVDKVVKYASTGICNRPLKLAATLGDEQLTKCLLQYGANLDCASEDSRKLLTRAFESLSTQKDQAASLSQRRSLIGTLINAGARPEPELLHAAIAEGLDHWLVETLMRMASDLNARNTEGQTPLHVAVTTGQGGLVGELIELSANVNALDRNQRSVLHYAVEKAGNLQMVQDLLNAGGDPNAKDRARISILLLAIHESHDPDIVMALVAAGSDVNEVTSFRISPLHYALVSDEAVDVTPGHVVGNATDRIIQALVLAGADVNAVDTHGSSVCDWALRSRYAHARIHILQNSGKMKPLLQHDAPAPVLRAMKTVMRKGLSLPELFRRMEPTLNREAIDRLSNRITRQIQCCTVSGTFTKFGTGLKTSGPSQEPSLHSRLMSLSTIGTATNRS